MELNYEQKLTTIVKLAIQHEDKTALGNETKIKSQVLVPENIMHLEVATFNPICLY